MEKKRYELLDAWRGLTIISMIGYHFSFDVFILYGLYPKFLYHPLAELWQQSICISFIILSGLCASFSKNLWKRGILLNLCGFLITAVTVIATPSAAVWFGVLNLLGCSLILIIPVRKLVTEKNWVVVAIICLFSFLFFRHVSWGYLGFGDIELIQLPEFLYRVKWLIPMGFPYPGFSSSDYFPIIPWFFLFLFGYAISFGLQESDRIQKMLMPKVPVLSWMGKHSLMIYMLHQPVLMGICILIF